MIGRWVEKYDPTIEESYQTTVDIDGKALQVEILDTAGQDEYRPLRETFMHTGDGFLLVYSITDDQTFEELRGIREQILRVHRDRKVPMVIVGNKVDLASTDRAVSKEEGQKLATEFNATFMEITAKEDFKVKDAFAALVRKVLVKNPSAGSDTGTGTVFGAGKVDNSGEGGGELSPAKKTKDKDKKGGDSQKKKRFSLVGGGPGEKRCLIL